MPHLHPGNTVPNVLGPCDNARMNLKDAMKALEAAGSTTHRKTYQRHGIGEPMFGVPYSFLTPFVRKIGCDHALALQLWSTGNHDARLVATMIADPLAADGRLIERWLKDATNYPLNGAVATAAAAADIPISTIERWCAARDEWTSTLGWSVLGQRVSRSDSWSDEQLKRTLLTIERRIHTAPNRTRHAMNSALIAIGCRGGALQQAAVAAANRIGAVDVDHGDTGCKTPDAAAYIAKTMARRQSGPAAKPARKTAAKARVKRAPAAARR
jgi:3-methyladenine DNA glycosylase AlkD